VSRPVLLLLLCLCVQLGSRGRGSEQGERTVCVRSLDSRGLRSRTFIVGLETKRYHGAHGLRFFLLLLYYFFPSFKILVAFLLAEFGTRDGQSEDDHWGPRQRRREKPCCPRAFCYQERTSMPCHRDFCGGWWPVKSTSRVWWMEIFGQRSPAHAPPFRQSKRAAISVHHLSKPF
jgi:hypothetical protein